VWPGGGSAIFKKKGGKEPRSFVSGSKRPPGEKRGREKRPAVGLLTLLPTLPRGRGESFPEDTRRGKKKISVTRRGDRRQEGKVLVAMLNAKEDPVSKKEERNPWYLRDCVSSVPRKKRRPLCAHLRGPNSKRGRERKRNALVC